MTVRETNPDRASFTMPGFSSIRKWLVPSTSTNSAEGASFPTYERHAHGIVLPDSGVEHRAGRAGDGRLGARGHPRADRRPQRLVLHRPHHAVEPLDEVGPPAVAFEGGDVGPRLLRVGEVGAHRPVQGDEGDGPRREEPPELADHGRPHAVSDQHRPLDPGLSHRRVHRAGEGVHRPGGGRIAPAVPREVHQEEAVAARERELPGPEGDVAGPPVDEDDGDRALAQDLEVDLSPLQQGEP